MVQSREIILASYPNGLPSEENFSLKEKSLGEIQDSQIFLKTLFLSVDPYMRGRMREGKGSYISGFELGKPIVGGAIAEVVDSKNPSFKKGDKVLGILNWSDYSIVKGDQIQKLDPHITPLSWALGVLGMPGFTGYFGLLDIGKPNSGETVVVSGAAGAVGTVAGQIAKLKGCRVVGIAGGAEKKRYLLEKLKLDAVIDYKTDNIKEALKETCPKGIDIYFDNVGGDITDQVIMQINKHARVIMCGQISMYNSEKSEMGPRLFPQFIVKSALLKGFIVSDYQAQFGQAFKDLLTWTKEGKIKYHETITKGLENTPKAFIGLFKGENLGKQMVKLVD